MVYGTPQAGTLPIEPDCQRFVQCLHRAAWQQKLRPDLLLCVKGFIKEYPVHTVILCSQSAFFEKALVTWGAARSSASAMGCALPRHALVLGEEVTEQGTEHLGGSTPPGSTPPRSCATSSSVRRGESYIAVTNTCSGPS